MSNIMLYTVLIAILFFFQSYSIKSFSVSTRTSWRHNRCFAQNRLFLQRASHALKLAQNDNVEENSDNENVQSNEETEIESEQSADSVDASIANDIDQLINALNETIANTTTTEDPLDAAIRAKEQELQRDLQVLEFSLRSERQKNLKLQDKISESGKMGFFMIQAQVTDFQRKRDADQKEQVLKNKRDFVLKIIPIIDEYRDAISKAVSNSDREAAMHTNFGSLLPALLLVLEKSGYKEFTAESGTKLDKYKHDIIEVQEIADTEEGIILDMKRPGIIYNDNEIIRKALVVSSGKVSVKAEES